MHRPHRPLPSLARRHYPNLILALGLSHDLLAGYVHPMFFLHVLLRLSDEFFVVVGSNRMSHRTGPMHFHLHTS